MSAVFFLMSWCMIVQVSAMETRNTMPCHTSAPGSGKNSRETPGMERCCQSGVLKGQEKFKAVFQLVDILPVSALIGPSAVTLHRLDFVSQPLQSPPTAQRLAELSLLRI